jgi:hypothetical protein
MSRNSFRSADRKLVTLFGLFGFHKITRNYEVFLPLPKERLGVFIKCSYFSHSFLRKIAGKGPSARPAILLAHAIGPWKKPL